MKREGLDGIVRAHTCVLYGFQKHYLNGKKKAAPVTTLFSAPNYCGKGNMGAYALTDEHNFEISQFKWNRNSPHLGGKQNAFDYFMIDISAWVDEFVYELFYWADTIDAEMAQSISKES